MIRRQERVGIFKVDLVLTGGPFVVGGLDLKTHLIEGKHDIPPGVFTTVDWRQVEIPALVVGDGGRNPLFVKAEKEELAFRADIDGVTNSFGFLDTRRRITGVADKRLAVLGVDVTDQTGDLISPGFPGKEGKGFGNGPEVHIRLFNTGKPLNSGTVKHNLVVQGFFQLLDGDGDILYYPQDIRELQADEFYL